jgi:hypothetical protein
VKVQGKKPNIPKCIFTLRIKNPKLSQIFGTRLPNLIQIGVFLGYIEGLEKHYNKMGNQILKKKICNNNYGHLKFVT